MKFHFKNLYPLYKDILRHHKSIEHFNIEYNHVQFDIILDIGTTPFQMMIGAVHHNLAFILSIERGFETEIPDHIYYDLMRILNLNFKENGFTSFSFLKFIDNHTPNKCTPQIVNPDYLLRFRSYYNRDANEQEKTRFIGWNDHTKDKRTAHNFDKTEQYFGKAVADFCRSRNISSIWTVPGDTAPRNIDFPPGYPTVI